MQFEASYDRGKLSFLKVNRFVDKTNSLRDRPIDDDTLTVLRKFELLRNDAITFGCFLLFGKEPTLSTTIDAGRFDSETIIRDSRTIRTDLFAEVDECLEKEVWFRHQTGVQNYVVRRGRGTAF